MSPWNMSVKFRGREVRNPALRVLVGLYATTFGVLSALIGFTVAFVVVVALIVLSPVWVLLHFILVACGRVGFVTRSPGKVNIKVSAAGFRKAS